MDTVTKTEDLMQPMRKAASFGQDYAAAMMRASQIWVSGCRAIGEDITAAIKVHAELTVTTMTSLSHVKSPVEALEIQSTFARTSMEGAASNANKLAEATKKLLEDASAPIKEQMSHLGSAFSKMASPPHIPLM
jgi:hypothetical protein